MLRNYHVLVHVIAVLYITKSNGNPAKSAREAFIYAMDDLSNPIYQLRNQATFKDEARIKNMSNTADKSYKNNVYYNAIYLLSPSKAKTVDDGYITYTCSKYKRYEINYALGSYSFTGDFMFNGYHNFNISFVDMIATFEYKEDGGSHLHNVYIVTKEIHMGIDACKSEQDLTKRTIKEIAADFTTSLTKIAAQELSTFLTSPYSYAMPACGRKVTFTDTYKISESLDEYNCIVCISVYNVNITGSLNWNDIMVEYMNKMEYKFNATVNDINGITEWNYNIDRNGTSKNSTETKFRIKRMELIGECSGADKKFTFAKEIYMDIVIDPIKDDNGCKRNLNTPAILEPLLKNKLKQIIRHNFLQ